jgi:hypothetical protein
MDVHRKGSQIAIVDGAGAQQRNRNLANDPVTLVPILGVPPPGPPGPAGHRTEAPGPRRAGRPWHPATLGLWAAPGRTWLADLDLPPTPRAIIQDCLGDSDRNLRHGHSTKQGSPWAWGIVQEAAQTAKRHPMFAGTYAQLARRRAATSPPPRSPGGCWPAASRS